MAAALVSAMLGGTAVHAEDWPFLRGPRFDASTPESGLIDWGGAGPGVAWTADLGQGYSACVAGAGRVFTMYQDAFGQHLACFRLTDGRPEWQTSVGAPYDLVSIYPGPRSTPTYAEGRVYYTTPDGTLACVEADSGKPVWSQPFWRQLQGRGAEFGYAASPLVWRDRIVLPVGGPSAAVAAFDRHDGHLIWKSGEGEASYCSLLPIELDGKPLLVAYLQNDILILDPGDGRVWWNQHLSGGYDEHSAWPLYADAMLVFSAPFRAGAQAYRLAWTEADGQRNLSVRSAWDGKQLSNDTASSVIVDGSIYGFDLRDPQAKAHRASRGEFRCLDLQTGAVHWSSARPGHATIAVAEGKLWLLNDRGELILVRANREEYEELGRVPVFLDETCWTPPAIADGKLLLRSPGHLACLEISAASATVPASDDPAVAMRRPFTIRWDWLLNGEREHPFMPPEPDELTLWFQAGCWLALLPVTVIVALGRRLSPGTAWPEWSCALATIFGIVATPLANATSDEFVFTWPLALSSAALGTFLASNHYALEKTSRRRGRQARLVGLGFFGLLTAYFLVLRRYSLPFEWVFLCGILPGMVILWPIAHRVARTRSLTLTIAGLWLGYAVLFWSAAAFTRIR